jgi:hypothetical protein
MIEAVKHTWNVDQFQMIEAVKHTWNVGQFLPDDVPEDNCILAVVRTRNLNSWKLMSVVINGTLLRWLIFMKFGMISQTCGRPFSVNLIIFSPMVFNGLCFNISVIYTKYEV